MSCTGDTGADRGVRGSLLVAPAPSRCRGVNLPLVENGFSLSTGALDLTASGILDGLEDEDAGVGRPWVIVAEFGVDKAVGNENFSFRTFTAEEKEADSSGSGYRLVNFVSRFDSHDLFDTNQLVESTIHQIPPRDTAHK